MRSAPPKGAAAALVGLGLGLGVAAGVALAAAAAVHDHSLRRRRDKIAHDDATLAADVAEYMRKSFANLVVAFKRKHGDDAPFERFILEAFPENASRDERSGRVLLDERVRSDAWEGAFHRLSASDVLYDLRRGPPTGRM